jgi:hypothetical protein
MIEYPKIETLFERDESFRVTDVLKRPIFADISRWIVTEKVDGTNIRVSYSRAEGAVRLGGRSDNAQIHADLVRHLQDTFTPEKMAALFVAESDPATRITLFGEGYGAGIQKGGGYRQDKAFILFDVLIEPPGEVHWQDDAVVTSFAASLGIPRVPILGEWSLDEIVERVQAGVPSVCASTPMTAEGIVARPREPLFDKRHRRLILKLKSSDFKPGKR